MQITQIATWIIAGSVLMMAPSAEAKISANKISANKISSNSSVGNRSTGAGGFFDIKKIELKNGARIER
jgi:hypothetical protein